MGIDDLLDKNNKVLDSIWMIRNMEENYGRNLCPDLLSKQKSKTLGRMKKFDKLVLYSEGEENEKVSNLKLHPYNRNWETFKTFTLMLKS